jgi:hypothetical protein
VEQFERPIARLFSVPGGCGDDVRRPLSNRQGRAAGVGQLLVSAFETVPVGEIGADELGVRAGEADVVTEPCRPVGKPLRMIRARRAIERDAP